MLVLNVIRTIYAAIYTVIRQIQRRKHNYPVAVEILLYLFSQITDLRCLIWYLTCEEYRCLPVCQPLPKLCLLDYRVYELHIVLVTVRIIKSLPDLCVIYEVLRLHGSHIIHFFCLLSHILYALPIKCTLYIYPN